MSVCVKIMIQIEIEKNARNRDRFFGPHRTALLHTAPTDTSAGFCLISVLPLSAYVGIGRCLSSLIGHVESAFVRSWNF